MNLFSHQNVRCQPENKRTSGHSYVFVSNPRQEGSSRLLDHRHHLRAASVRSISRQVNASIWCNVTKQCKAVELLSSCRWTDDCVVPRKHEYNTHPRQSSVQTIKLHVSPLGSPFSRSDSFETSGAVALEKLSSLATRQDEPSLDYTLQKMVVTSTLSRTASQARWQVLVSGLCTFFLWEEQNAILLASEWRIRARTSDYMSWVMSHRLSRSEPTMRHMHKAKGPIVCHWPSRLPGLPELQRTGLVSQKWSEGSSKLVDWYQCENSVWIYVCSLCSEQDFECAMVQGWTAGVARTGALLEGACAFDGFDELTCSLVGVVRHRPFLERTFGLRVRGMKGVMQPFHSLEAAFSVDLTLARIPIMHDDGLDEQTGRVDVRFSFSSWRNSPNKVEKPVLVQKWLTYSYFWSVLLVWSHSVRELTITCRPRPTLCRDSDWLIKATCLSISSVLSE